jgi:hypothetical protein
MNRRAMRRVVTATAATALAAGGALLAAAPAQAAAAAYFCNSAYLSGTTVYGTGCSGHAIEPGGAYVYSGTTAMWLCRDGATVGPSGGLVGTDCISRPV